MNDLTLKTVMFDRAGQISRIERMRLLKESKELRQQLDSGELKRVARMKAVMRSKEIRAILGGGDATKPGESEHIALLRSVLQGAHDALGIGALLDKIDAAINALAGAGELQGDTDRLGEQSIEHWAGLVPVAG